MPTEYETGLDPLVTIPSMSLPFTAVYEIISSPILIYPGFVVPTPTPSKVERFNVEAPLSPEEEAAKAAEEEEAAKAKGKKKGDKKKEGKKKGKKKKGDADEGPPIVKIGITNV